MLRKQKEGKWLCLEDRKHSVQKGISGKDVLGISTKIDFINASINQVEGIIPNSWKYWDCPVNRIHEDNKIVEKQLVSLNNNPKKNDI